MTLSKSLNTRGIKCLKSLWLKKYSLEVQQTSRYIARSILAAIKWSGIIVNISGMTDDYTL